MHYYAKFNEKRIEFCHHTFKEINRNFQLFGSSSFFFFNSNWHFSSVPLVLTHREKDAYEIKARGCEVFVIMEMGFVRKLFRTQTVHRIVSNESAINDACGGPFVGKTKFLNKPLKLRKH